MTNLPYDPSTVLGQCRFHCADTNQAVDGTYIFTDAELDYCLSNAANIPMLAAAQALRAAAADNAKVAVITKIGQMGDDESKVYRALIEMAEALESRVIQPAAVQSYDRVFSNDADGGTNPGTMTGW